MTGEDVPLREKDLTVLQCIQEDHADTRRIREATTLSNRDVHYCFDKLEDRDLIKTYTPEGRTTEIVEGQKRNFKQPRQANLTELGLSYLHQNEHEQTAYREMSQNELIERVHRLEEEISDFQEQFQSMRKQVLKRLQDR